MDTLDYNKLIHEAHAQQELRKLGVHERTAHHIVKKHGHQKIFELLRDEKELILFLLREVEELKDEIREEHRAHSGTTSFKSKTGVHEDMDISVHVSEVPKVALAREWTGANGTGTQVPATGAIVFTSDNPAAVTVDPVSGALAYVAAGVANISWTDAGLPDLVVASGSVTVSEDPAISGTTDFVDAAPPAPPVVTPLLRAAARPVAKK